MSAVRPQYLQERILGTPLTSVLRLNTRQHHGLLLAITPEDGARVLAYDAGARPVALNVTRTLQLARPASSTHYLLQALRQWTETADAAAMQTICEHLTPNPATFDEIYDLLLEPCEPDHVGGLLRQYALSDQAEPFVPYLSLVASKDAQLDLGVWTDRGQCALFLDGVPVRHGVIQGDAELQPLLNALKRLLMTSHATFDELCRFRAYSDDFPRLIQCLRGQVGAAPAPR